MKPLFRSENPAPTPGSTALIAALLALLLWDASGADLALAAWYGSASGFAWQHHPWLTHLAHDGVRRLGWVLLAVLTLGIGWPLGPLRALSRRERAHMVLAAWLCIAAVAAAKGISRTSCPWDMQLFGGTVPYVSHWNWWRSDGGPGHCFPGGHASTALAFLPVGWWLRSHRPRLGAAVLTATVAAGLLLGWVQQVRGAHYLSHNLWTLWICWAVTALTHRLCARAIRMN